MSSAAWPELDLTAWADTRETLHLSTQIVGRNVRPAAARWPAEMGEWILPYDAVRKSADPEGDLLAFLEDTYAAAADLGDWDRKSLERTEQLPPLDARKAVR